MSLRIWRWAPVARAAKYGLGARDANRRCTSPDCPGADRKRTLHDDRGDSASFPSQLAASVITFREYTLREAEGALAHRCLTDEALLVAALRQMPRDSWRTDSALEVIFCSLGGMLIRGAYDPETNEDYMACALACREWVGKDYSKGHPVPSDFLIEWQNFLADLWDGNTAVPEVSTALLASIIETYRRQDAAVVAIRRELYDGPFKTAVGSTDELYKRLYQDLFKDRPQRLTNQRVLPGSFRSASVGDARGSVRGLPI